MTKRKTITYTDSEGKKYEIPLFDTELTLGNIKKEEIKSLEDELKLDEDVKQVAQTILKIKKKSSNSKVYYDIGRNILCLLKKHRKKGKDRGFRAVQSILERIIIELSRYNIKGISVQQLRTMVNFASLMKEDEVNPAINWSIYSEVFSYKLTDEIRNTAIDLIHTNKLLKRDDVRKWIKNNRSSKE